MNIVTIDFDIIMGPSIQLYGSMDKDKELINYQADLNIYNKISYWLYNSVKNLSAENIIFIESHENIIHHVPKDKDITLINIDHHHDLGYNLSEKSIIQESELNCGNWGAYLLNNNLIKSFIWLCNPTSNKDWSSSEKYNYINEYNLDNLKADKIIICYSPTWVPKSYHPLFFNWLNTISIMKDTHFFIS